MSVKNKTTSIQVWTNLQYPGTQQERSRAMACMSSLAGRLRAAEFHTGRNVYDSRLHLHLYERERDAQTSSHVFSTKLTQLN